MVTEAQRDQIERRAVMRQDASLREQTGTYMSHTHDDALGRWREHGAAFVVGSTPVPNYPAAGAHQADPCGPEPPLSFDNPALEPPTLSPSAVQAGDAVVAPSTNASPGLMSEHTASPLWSLSACRRWPSATPLPFEHQVEDKAA